MNSYARSLFRRARALGYTALESLSIARTADAFDDAVNEGLVRIEALPDEDYRPEDWSDDKRDREAYERDGAWGVVTRYLDQDGEWQVADSVWGFVGYRDVLDPVENCYVADLMSAALDSLSPEAMAI